MEKLKSGQSFVNFGCNKYSYVAFEVAHETVEFLWAKKHFEAHSESMYKILTTCYYAIREIIDDGIELHKNMFYVGQLQPELFEEKYNNDLCEWITNELKKQYSGCNMDCKVKMSYCADGGSNVYVGYDLSQFDDEYCVGILQIIVL